MDYLAGGIFEEVLKEIEIMQAQLDDVIVKLEKARKQLIIKAIEQGWTREEIETKLQAIEK